MAPTPQPEVQISASGQMARRIEEFDWSATPLGPRSHWPANLDAAVRMILAARYPMFVWWGREFINLHNDAYAPVLGARHPAALGQPAMRIWSEVWSVVGPQAEAVLHRGASTWNEEVLLTMERYDFTEETYFTFGYSPLTNNEGAVAGLLGVCTEETARVLGRRRLKTLRDLGDRALLEGKTTEDAARAAITALSQNPYDVPFALLYLLDADGKTARLAQSVGCPNAACCGETIVLNSAQDVWELSRVLETPGVHTFTDLRSRVGVLAGGAWPEPVNRAVVVPLARSGAHEFPAGFLISGLSPRLLFHEDYRGFLELAGGQIATAIANARAYEEERKRAEALAEIDRVKTQFFSNVSHEFRTPLTLMLGPLENVLARRDGLSPQDREEIETAHRNSLRLLKLVNSLLDFSRIEAGRMRASLEPVDLAAFTAELASNFRSAAEAAGLRFVVQCEPLPKLVPVDRQMWEKIVLNLLSNAFKFTLAGQIAVRMDAGEDGAVLVVEDTGIGIAEAELPRIFERFHRVDSAIGRTHEGSGIGLALVQELVKLQGGEIGVESVPGAGSKFTVKVPFGTANAAAGGTLPSATAVGVSAFVAEAEGWVSTAQTGKPGSGRAHILVADDNADMREHLFRLLDGDYHVVTVADGMAAIEAMRRARPDLVLSDIMMPGVDGIGLLAAIRRDPQIAQIPVILVSARAGEDERSDGMSAGADDYLVKPFSARELKARVGAHLKLAKARREAEQQAQAVLESITDAFAAVDSEWRFTYLNARGEELLGGGMRRTDLLGKRVWDAVPELVGSPVEQEFRKVMEQRVPVEFENHFHSSDRWFHLKVYPATDGGISVFYEDITGTKRAESDRLVTEDRFRAFIIATSDVVYRMSADWTEMRQLGGKQFIADTRDPSRTWLENYIPPEEQPLVCSAIAEAIHNGTIFELEHRVYRLDGSIGWTFSRAVPLRNSKGEVIEWFGTARDVTESKRTEEKRATQRHILELIARGEELPNILGKIDEFVQMLQPSSGADAEVLQIAEKLRLIAKERDRTVQALRVRSEELQTILDIVPIPVWIASDPECREIRGNRTGQELYQLPPDANVSPEAPTPLPIRHFRNGQEVAASDLTIQRAAATGEPVLNDELEVHLPDGRRITIAGGAVPLKNPDGSVRGVVAALMDVTERKAAEEKIARSEHVLSELVTRAPFGVYIVDSQFRIAEVNTSSRERAFRNVRPLIGRDFAEAIRIVWPEPIATAVIAEFRRTLETGQPYCAPKFVNARNDIDMVEAYEWELHRVVLPDGQFGVVCYYFDSTELRNAEAALQRTKDELETTLNLLPMPVWFAFDPECREIKANRAAHELYRVGPDFRWTESGSGLLTDFSHTIGGRPVPAKDLPLQRAARLGDPQLGYELEVEFSDGRRICLSGGAVPLRDAEGRVRGAVAALMDVTEMKRIEAELRRANVDLEQFAYSASHDLQEPLRTVKIFSELLGERYRSQLDEQAQQFLTHVNTGATRMEALVRDLLSYTRTGKTERPPEPQDAAKALRMALDSLAVAIAESGAEVEAGPLPVLPVNSAHMQQLFQNMISNAIKYRAPGRLPKITVRAEREGGTWLFAVSDNGIGIKPQYRERIFGLFKRLHTQDEYSGTGIGLALCKRIVEQYRGRIWVDSDPEYGSTFYFTLPV